MYLKIKPNTSFAFSLPSSPVATGDFGWLSPPKHSSSHPNWNMKHNKLVEFRHIWMSSPPARRQSPPAQTWSSSIDHCQATVLVPSCLYCHLQAVCIIRNGNYRYRSFYGALLTSKASVRFLRHYWLLCWCRSPILQNEYAFSTKGRTYMLCKLYILVFFCHWVILCWSSKLLAHCIKNLTFFVKNTGTKKQKPFNGRASHFSGLGDFQS